MRIQFGAKRGHYQIVLENKRNSQVSIILILPKAGLTELMPRSRFVGTREGIYEIYIPEGYYAMIELFECSGEIKLRGSNSYD